MYKNKFILISHYWGGDKYIQFAKRLKLQCKKLGIKNHIVYKKHFNGLYQKAINSKPTFLLNMMKKFY